MAMFGAQAAKFNPSALSPQDRLMLLGATLRDTGSALRGADSDALLNTQALLASRQQEAAKQAFLQQFTQRLQPQYRGGQGPQLAAPQVNTDAGPALDTVSLPGRQPGLIGQQAPSSFDYQPPQRVSNGLDINSPDLPALALAARQNGVDLSGVLDVLKAQQPDIRYDGGFGYNSKTGAPAGQFHPRLDIGEGVDASGGVVNLPGSVQAAADRAAAVEGAKAKATAPFEFQTLTGPDGRPNVVTSATAAALGSRGGLIAQGQSPAEAAAAKAKSDAQTAAQITLPQTVNTATQALSLIDSMKSNPALKARTGLLGAFPAIPGTPGADFDAMAEQLKGKVFLEAFGSLKGGGQITEVEGKKATAAIARLNQTQSTPGYVAALNDLESVIKAGLQRAQNQASGGATRVSPADSLSSIPAADRLAEARRRGLIP